MCCLRCLCCLACRLTGCPGCVCRRYIRFGVREHAMAAISNGIAAYGGFLPYCATFLNFCGYALGAVRVSALSHFRVLYMCVRRVRHRATACSTTVKLISCVSHACVRVCVLAASRTTALAWARTGPRTSLSRC